MDKLEFVAKQLDKTKRKKYEQLVVHRIWNSINDLRVKFITQQFVKRPEGRALTDMYFPQLGIHIEVDEGHHKSQIEADKLREADIIDATGHRVLRVDVTENIEKIHDVCDSIAELIRKEILSNDSFLPWDLEAEMNPNTYIENGYIDVRDDASFRTMVDAANCFGLNIKPKGIWTGGAKHPIEANTLIWFPKLYQNKDWNNEISDDENIITEMSVEPEPFKKHFERVFREKEFTRIVFPRFKGPLGDFMYRFKGIYELDLGATSFENGFVWRRAATRVRTYARRDNSTNEKNKSIRNEEAFIDGINYVINEEGQRVAVIIGLEKHGQLWKDFCDTLISQAD